MVLVQRRKRDYLSWAPCPSCPACWWPLPIAQKEAKGFRHRQGLYPCPVPPCVVSPVQISILLEARHGRACGMHCRLPWWWWNRAEQKDQSQTFQPDWYLCLLAKTWDLCHLINNDDVQERMVVRKTEESKLDKSWWGSCLQNSALTYLACLRHEILSMGIQVTANEIWGENSNIGFKRVLPVPGWPLPKIRTGSNVKEAVDSGRIFDSWEIGGDVSWCDVGILCCVGIVCVACFVDSLTCFKDCNPAAKMSNGVDESFNFTPVCRTWIFLGRKLSTWATIVRNKTTCFNIFLFFVLSTKGKSYVL